MLTEIIDQNASNHSPTSSAQAQVETLQDSLGWRSQFRRHSRAKVRNTSCPDSRMCHTWRDETWWRVWGPEPTDTTWEQLHSGAGACLGGKLQKPSTEKCLWSTNQLLVTWCWQPSHRETWWSLLMQSPSIALSPSKMSSLLFVRCSP